MLELIGSDQLINLCSTRRYLCIIWIKFEIDRFTLIPIRDIIVQPIFMDYIYWFVPEESKPNMLEDTTVG